MEKNDTHEISGPEWWETWVSPLGRLVYKNRFSKGEIEGIPDIIGPKLIARRNYNKDTVEFVFTGSHLATNSNK